MLLALLPGRPGSLPNDRAPEQFRNFRHQKKVDVCNHQQRNVRKNIRRVMSNQLTGFGIDKASSVNWMFHQIRDDLNRLGAIHQTSLDCGMRKIQQAIELASQFAATNRVTLMGPFVLSRACI